jgi:hypothetical protein
MLPDFITVIILGEEYKLSGFFPSPSPQSLDPIHPQPVFYP